MAKQQRVESTNAADRQRAAMTKALARTLRHAGFDTIGIRGENGTHAPYIIHSPRTGGDYTPDITAKKNGVAHIMQVETTDSLASYRARHQMKVFATYADSQCGLFCLVVPEGCRAKADHLLVEQGVFANIIELPPHHED